MQTAPHANPTRDRDPQLRRGTVYIAVFALAMLVFVIGVGGVMAARVRARAVFLGANASESAQYARSAVDLGRLWIATDPTWRADRASGTWISGSTFGSGTISLDVTNPAGALNRSVLDPVVLVGTGVKGAARQKMTATLVPSVTALSCLRAVVCSGGAFTVGSKTINASGLTLATNSDFSANSSTINANVEAAGTVSGGTYNGTKTSGAAARSLPSVTTVVNEFTLIGSAGSWSSVPILSGSRTLQNQLIGPNSGPAGATAQANGVYILDCKGGSLAFQGLRVVGTLVLANCGGLTIKGPVNWTPAVPGYPCLVVQGSLTIDQDAASLSEATVMVNLNPASTPYPYPSGAGNATSADVYPCGFNGLVYVSGNLTVNKPGWVLGPTVVGGAVSVQDSISFFPCPECVTSPAPGFADVAMVVSAGSWAQSVD